MDRRALGLSPFLLALCIFSTPASADSVQWEIRGTVTDVTGDAEILEGRFPVGTPWMGTVGWDTELEDLDPATRQGLFRPQPGLGGPFLSLALDGETFAAEPASEAYTLDAEAACNIGCLEIVIVLASEGAVQSSLPTGPDDVAVDYIDFQLWARGDADNLQGPELPAELDLVEFSESLDLRIVSIYFSRGETRAFVYGTIDSLTPLPEPPLAIEVDVMPRREVNRIDLLRRGVVRVAVLGTESFDVLDVDSSTLRFGPDDAQPLHPVDGRVRDVNRDEIDDLVLRFRAQDAGIAPGDTEACIRGELLDATPIEGCDEITTVPACGLGFELAVLLPPLMVAYHSRRRAGRGPRRPERKSCTASGIGSHR